MGLIRSFNNLFRETVTFGLIDQTVRSQARKNKEVIAGSQSIKAQVGIFARQPGDYDLLSSNPLKSAMQLERSLDKQSGRDLFFTRASMFHPVTKKVIFKGADGRKNTKDDIGIADYSPLKKVPVRRIGGLRFVALSSIKKDKRTALKDKQFAFRHEKDQEDLDRINLARF